MKRWTFFWAALLALGAFLYVTVPASASCGNLGVQLDDGSGHIYTLNTTGTCSNPTFGKSDLNIIHVSVCQGAFQNQGDLNDCINRVRFVGTWPANFEMFTYRDTGYGLPGLGGPQYKCDHNSWITLSGADSLSSFIVTSSTNGCT